MKMGMKRLSSIALVFAICLTVLPMQAYAATFVNETVESPNYSTGASSFSELNERLTNLTSKYAGTYWTSTGCACSSHSDTCYSKYYYGWQCKGFAGYIFNDLFCGGYIGAYDSGYYNIPSPTNATLIGQKINIASTDSASVQSLLSQAKPGDFIQAHRRDKTYGHSMIVVSVDSYGVTLFDCNSDGHCGVKKYYQTWATFASKNDSFSLYRSTKYPSDSEKAPAAAKIAVNKDSFSIGETFTLTMSSDVSAQYYLAILDADTGERVVECDTASTYTNAFQKAGKYYAYCSAWNSKGSVDSNWLTFYVFGPPPTTATFSVDKTEIAKGDSVTLSTCTDAYWVRICISIFNNSEKVYAGDNIPYAYVYKPESPGVYSAYISAYTHEGSVDSNWVTFHVGQYDITYNANGGSGAPSGQTKTYGKALTLSSEMPVREGYTFLGWSTDPGASIPTYLPSDTYDENSAITLYAVWSKSVSGVSISSATLNLEEGESSLLIATVLPDNASNKAVQWSSSNADVATVSNGMVTAVSAGTATITATTEDGGFAAECVVSVNSSDILSAPTVKVSNVASSGKIKLSWNAVSGAAKYQVYRATSKDGTYSLLYTTTGTSMVNTSTTAGKTYYYKVRAVAADGSKSKFSDIVSRTCDLAQPVITVSNKASNGKPVIKWDAVSGAKEYKVYRATSKNGTYSLLKTTTGTSLTNTSAVAGKTYYYKVKAICSVSAGNSAFSAIKSRTCDLAQPVISVSNNASTGKIVIKWDAVDGAQKYQVYRATSKNGTYSLLKTTTGTTLVNTSTTAGKTYYYKVKAICSVSTGNSAFSEIKSRTCDLAQPVVTASRNSDGNPVLKWAAIDGAEKYKVYRSTSKTGTYNLLGTVTGTKMTNTSVTAGKTYYYKVKAIASVAAADSAPSAIVYVTAK